MKVESLTGYLMSEDRKIAEIENGKILKFDSALLPLYLERKEDKAGKFPSAEKSVSSAYR